MRMRQLFSTHSPEAPALVHGDERRTWAELDRNVAAASVGVADALAAAGRTLPGAVVAVLGDTSIGFLEAVFGASEAGASVLPLHARYPVTELSRACAIAAPSLIVAVGDDAQARALAAACDGHAPIVTTHAALLEHDPTAAVAVERAPDDPALLLFTSGTAGPARVAALSQANLTASITQTIAAAPDVADHARCMLGVMPLTHVLGLVSVVGVALVAGSTLVLPAATDAETVAAEVARHEVTLLVAPPVFWYRLARSGVDRASLSSVTFALSGAAPLSGQVASAVADRFGLSLRQGYGLTEASSGLTTSAGTEAPATSVGRPMPGVELRLVDDFGDDALVGDVGEVWARGANVFAGYWADEDATAAVLDADGWLRTGDLAVVDESGHLYIVGRTNDRVIVGGFNVHPGEVEDHLAAHPEVAGAAVTGEADREYGEVLVAWVVLEPGAAVTEDAIRAHCRTGLAGYKVPARVEFVDELPQSLTGKLRRRVLRSR